MEYPFGGVFPETELALLAIQKASERITEIYGGSFESAEKADRSPVTIGDLESHRIITDVLSQSGIAVISEEGERPSSKSAPRFWLVDPLDGTREFVDRNGEFTIMIALVERGRPMVGLISHPVANSVYVAQRGSGAFRLNRGKWEKLHASRITTLHDSRAVISRSHVSPEELEFIGSLGISGHTRLGSSLKALRICSGDAELYFAANTKMKQWDTCASHCLVSESGGKMTDMYGKEIIYDTAAPAHETGVVITNGLVHDEFIAKCAPFRARQFATGK